MGIRERKQREFARREREILATARPLLDHDDWLSVTVEQIAQAAEIGKGPIYKHFANKEAVYAGLTLDFFEGLFRQLEPTAASRWGGTVKPVVDAALERHSGWAEFRHPAYAHPRPLHAGPG